MDCDERGAGVSRILARLDRCAERIELLQEELWAERERRDRLIVQAIVRDGKTFRAVAHAARRRVSTIAAAVAKHGNGPV